MAKTQMKFYWGTGRRKTAVARVRVADGTGKIEINGRPLESYFTEVKDRNVAIAPLHATESLGKLDVFVNVKGGGFAGQAGAICQGMARAIKNMQPAAAPAAEGETIAPAPLVKKLRDSGLLTRDARMKERKKYGRRGARRSFQFSKR